MPAYRQFVRVLLRNYVIGSLVAVLGVGGVLVFTTLQISRHDALILLGTLVFSLVVMLAIESTVYLRHIRPIRDFFSETEPTLNQIQSAYWQVHRMPSLTVARTAGPHWLGLAIPASAISWFEISHHILSLPMRVVYIAIVASVLVAGMHAMIEYFLTSVSIKTMLNYLRTVGHERYGTWISLDGQVIASIRTKFQLSALVIGTFPLILFSLATQVRLTQASSVFSNHYWQWAAVMLVIGIGFSMIGAWLLSRVVQQPIEELQSKMKDIQDGIFDVRASDIYSDEFSRLVAGFNHMANGLIVRDERNAQLVESYFTTLAAALDARDPYTAGHSLRVAQYSVEIAKLAKLDAVETSNLRKSALLHDIGKIGIRDNILLKEGRLTPEEFHVMKMHPVLGEAILQQIQPQDAMAPLLAGVRSHHERFDGHGYPDGLKGLEIPLHGRIMAVADAFDAMTSDRPYRKGMPVDKALSILEDGQGTQWDPQMASLFVVWMRSKTFIDQTAVARVVSTGTN